MAIPDRSTRAVGCADSREVAQSTADPVGPFSPPLRSKRHSDELMTGTRVNQPALACALAGFGATSLLALAGCRLAAAGRVPVA